MISSGSIFFILLPIATLSGWLLGRRGRSKRIEQSCRKAYENYVKGLNYLLSDQDDKAIDLFLKLSQSQEGTAEIHFALATLYKKRGEMEKAIRIHQHLIANPTLDRDIHNKALNELALDYLKAGLFDRAEMLFLEIHNDKLMGQSANHHLLEIYQQEKEWEKAISVTQQLVKQEPQLKKLQAHYNCELAEIAFQDGDTKLGRYYLKQALKSDPNSVRATLLEGGVLFRTGDIKQAIKVFQYVEHQDPSLLSEVIQPLGECYRHQGTPEAMLHYLDELLHRYPDLAIADSIARSSFSDPIASYSPQLLIDFLKRNPSILTLRYMLSQPLKAEDPEVQWNIVREVVGQLWNGEHHYHCSACGFQSKSLYWRCPSCKTWSTIHPSYRTPRISRLH